MGSPLLEYVGVGRIERASAIEIAGFANDHKRANRCIERIARLKPARHDRAVPFRAPIIGEFVETPARHLACVVARTARRRTGDGAEALWVLREQDSQSLAWLQSFG